MSRVLTKKHVIAVFHDCVTGEGDSFYYSGIVRVKSTSHGVLEFDSGRLAKHREEIVAMLHQLPDIFRNPRCGGGLFLQAFQNHRGVNWTNQPFTVEMLFLLGMAVGAVERQRDLYHVECLGGKPTYLVVE